MRAKRYRERNGYRRCVEANLAGFGDMAVFGDDKGWWCQIHAMETRVRTGLGRRRKVECDFSPRMLSLTGKCVVFSIVTPWIR